MKLLIDSGATKTDFFLKTQHHEIIKFQCDGINVNYVDDPYIETQFKNFINQLHNIDYKHISKIKYYGAGCLNKINANRVLQILTRLFENAKVQYEEFKTDMFKKREGEEQIIFAYTQLLGKIAAAPTSFHMRGAIILIMPLLSK